MYDDNDASSFVSSKVLTLSLKNTTSDITVRRLTFAQKVPPVTLTQIDPSTYADEEDASGFTYHKIKYLNTQNDICLVVRPTDIRSLKQYDIYLRFGSYVDILNYDLTISVRQETNWVSCIRAKSLSGHVGNIQLGVGYKGKGK